MSEDSPSNAHEYSVGDLSKALKRAVEERFGNVRLRGEISGWKVPASGHAYFTLKDENAVIDAVMWRGQRVRLDFQPEDGLDVIAEGKVTTYAGRSKYQIVVERMRVAGAGALMALLEKRKAALAAEGLFAAERKRAIPFLPRTIGIVTSPTGAVIRDILHRLADRFPRDVILWPAKVQGDGAAEEIARGVEGLNAAEGFVRPDLIIVARGGGSIEDLWAFNEEVVVRAIAASGIPVVSAVGHETDTTLADFAADLRAPTPTAAAEQAVPVRADLAATVAEYGARLQAAIRNAGRARAERLRMIAARLPQPEAVLAARQQRFDDISARMPNPADMLARREDRFTSIAARLPKALAARAGVARQDLIRVSATLKPALLERFVAQRGDRAAALADRAVRAASQMLIRESAETKSITRRLDPVILRRRVTAEQRRLDDLGRVLTSLDPRGPLSRGFALVETETGVVTSAATAKREARMMLRFADDAVEVFTGAAPPPAKRPKPSARIRKPPAGQADLF
ncbi:exodeoxyribonuclease VII large subunit [Pacificimonas pallii]|nr:exodeoxyribonuclease VII large subunit [Pacificimonas pallii]